MGCARRGFLRESRSAGVVKWLVLVRLTFWLKDAGIIPSAPSVAAQLTTTNVPFADEDEDNTNNSNANRRYNTTDGTARKARGFRSKVGVVGRLACNGSGARVSDRWLACCMAG